MRNPFSNKKEKAMELLTPEHLKLMQNNGWATRLAQESERDEPDHFPVVKLFNPTGAATWLLTEMDTECPTSVAYGLCDLGMGEPELGSVSIYELESVVCKFGLRVERDLYWTATHPISVYAKAARTAGRIVTDRASLEAAAATVAAAKGGDQ